VTMFILQSPPSSSGLSGLVSTLIVGFVAFLLGLIAKRYDWRLASRQKEQEGQATVVVAGITDRAVLTENLLKRLEAVEKRCSELEDKLEDREKDYNTLFREHAQLQGELREVKGLFNELRRRYDDLRKRYVELRARYQTLTGEKLADDTADLEIGMPEMEVDDHAPPAG
jgi:chromosome segregation ATPase